MSSGFLMSGGWQEAMRRHRFGVRLVPWFFLVTGACLFIPRFWSDAPPAEANTSLRGTLPLPLENVVGSFLLIAGLLWFLPSVLARFHGERAGRERHIRVLEVCRLANGRSLVLADIAGRRIVVGVSEGGLTKVTELPESDSPNESSTDQGKPEEEFGQILGSALGAGS